jgi:release factor glutamine methyltransferase
MLELPATAAFDLLCANLPYIPQHKLKDLQVSRWEPVRALNGGVEGLDLILRLLEQSASRMAAGGLMLLEIEASQGDRASALARKAFPDADVRLHQDLAGLDRVLEIKLP